MDSYNILQLLQRFLLQTWDNSVLEWKGPGLHSALVPGRPRLTLINAHTTVSHTIPIYPRSLVGSGPSMHAPMNPMARVTVCSHFQKRQSNSGDSRPEFSVPIQNSLQNVKCNKLSTENTTIPGKGLKTQVLGFPIKRVRVKGTTPQIPTFPQF